MDSIKIEATARTPEVNFDFSGNTFKLKGKTYPENIAEFFDPIMEPLVKHLGKQKGAKIDFTFELSYFNSSSAKKILQLFDMLDETAGAGNDVIIYWACEEGDDIQENGEEFAEDLEHAKFQLVPI